MLQELDEEVRRRRTEISRVHLLRKGAKRPGLLAEVPDVEDTRRSREIILLQVVVQTRARRAEVRNARAHRDAGTRHDDYTLSPLERLDFFCDCPHAYV